MEHATVYIRHPIFGNASASIEALFHVTVNQLGLMPGERACFGQPLVTLGAQPAFTGQKA